MQIGPFASAYSIGPMLKYGFHILIKEEVRQTNRIDRQTDRQIQTEFNKKWEKLGIGYMCSGKSEIEKRRWSLLAQL